MNEVIEIQEQKNKRLKHKSNPLRSLDAYKLMELIEEERLLKDQLAEFWETRFIENRQLQPTVLF